MIERRLVFDPSDPEQLLIDIVKPRADWLDMTIIVGLMPDLLQAMESLSLPINGGEKFLQWVESGVIEDRTSELSQKHPVKRGLKGEFPQHAGLWVLAKEGATKKHVEMAALVVLVAHDWDFDLDESERNTYSTRLRLAWRALRLLSETAVQRIPNYTNDLEQFAEEFERRNAAIDRRTLNEKQIRYLEELQRFFKFYLGDGRIVRRSSGRSKNNLQLRMTGVWQKSASDTDTEVESNKRVTFHVTMPEKKPLGKTDHFLEGNAPEELAEESVLLEADSKACPELGERADSLVRKLQPQKTAYRRINSVLPGRWETLNEYELGVLLKSFFDGQWENPSEKSLICLTLLTGRAPQDVLKARVVKTRDQLPRAIEGPESIYLVLQDQTWTSVALSPQNRRKTRSKWRPYFDKTQQLLTFRIPDQFWSVLQSCVEKAALRVGTSSAMLFTGRSATEEMIVRIDGIIKALKKASGARLTLKRIQNHLFDELIKASNDLVEASLITGKHPPFGQSATIYYHTRAAEALAGYYEQVVLKWARMLPGNSQLSKLGHLDFDLPRVGSPFSLRIDVMKAVLESIREQLYEYSRAADQPEYLRKFHNLYTAHVHLMLFWGTGYRAVRDPIAERFEYNRKRHFLVIADKVTDGMGHSRVVFLPRQLIDQLDEYEKHRDYMARRLQLAGREITLSTFFWYVREDFELQPATPKALASTVMWAFPWPLNTSRHTLRGYLRDHAVPGDLVDAFMGHWGIGTEPWAKHSSLDPYAFRNTVEPVVTQFLNVLGFSVMEGLDG